MVSERVGGAGELCRNPQLQPQLQPQRRQQFNTTPSVVEAEELSEVCSHQALWCSRMGISW